MHYDGGDEKGLKSTPGFVGEDAQKRGMEFRALRRAESYIIYIMYITYITYIMYIIYIRYITFAASDIRLLFKCL